MRLLPIIFLILAISAHSTVVVDAVTGEPLPGASVFSHRGNLAAITTDKGLIPYTSPADYPLTIRYIGYATATVTTPSQSTVKLQEINYDLPEITVGTDRRDVLHITAYIREYSTRTTWTDTVTLFREKTVDFMVPSRRAGKYRGWLSPRLLASRSYYRFTSDAGTDSVSDRFSTHFSWSDWINIIDRIDIPAPLRDATTATDTIFGRYSPARIWRRNNDDITLQLDILADTANHRWVPGIFRNNRNNVEFTHFNINYDFTDAGHYTLLADNLARLSFYIETNGRGTGMQRIFHRDEPYEVSTYAELYITDREYITIKQARKIEKKPPLDLSAINPPDNLPPVDGPTLALINRVNTIDSDSLRSNLIPDQRLNRPHRVPIGPITALRNKIRSLVKKYRGH